MLRRILLASGHYFYQGTTPAKVARVVYNEGLIKARYIQGLYFNEYRDWKEYQALYLALRRASQEGLIHNFGNGWFGAKEYIPVLTTEELIVQHNRF